MAYEDEEVGSTTGRPIELYAFEGTYNDYFLTSYGFPIVSNSRTYTPVALKRNRLKVSTQEESGAALEIEMPFNHPMIREYAYENAPPSLNLTIFRCHESDPDDAVTMWNGPVTGFSVEGVIGKLRVPSLFSYILDGNVPAPRFQAPCNHILYDGRCGVDPALYQHSTTILSVSGNAITVASLPFASDEAAGGIMIGPSGESRMVISNAGTAVLITYSFANLQIGQTVTIRKGCDHSFEGHCKTRFNNGARFGGFPLVPARNPFTGSIE